MKERLYLVRGTLQQLSLGAFGSAISSARRAESLYVDAVDAADLNDYRDVLVALGVSLTALNGYANEEAHRAYQNAITIGIETKLPPHFPTLYGIWMYKLVSGVMTDADVDAKQMLQTALSEERFAVDRPQAYWAMGVTQYFIGNVVEAKRHFEAGIQLYEESRHAYYATSYVLDPGVANRYLLARALWFLGYPDQASRMVEESLALAKHLDHTESLAFAIVSAAIVHSVRGEPAKVKRLAEELFRISENDEHRQHWPWAKILHGWAIGAEGDAIQGLTELRQGLDRYEQMGAKLALSGFYAMEAHLCYRAGRLDEEAKVIRKAQEHINITGQRYYHPEFLRLEARNRGLRGLTDRNQLVLQLQAAREAALEIKSRSGELRIVSDLAEAFDQDGRPREALQLLEGFLRDFAEGADTTDVRRAAELLDRLQTKSLPTP